MKKDEIFMDVAKAFAYAENESNTPRFAAELKNYTGLRTKFLCESVTKAAIKIALTYTGNETPAMLGIKPQDITRYMPYGSNMTVLPTDKLSAVAECYYQKVRAMELKEMKKKAHQWGFTANEIFPESVSSIH